MLFGAIHYKYSFNQPVLSLVEINIQECAMSSLLFKDFTTEYLATYSEFSKFKS